MRTKLEVAGKAVLMGCLLVALSSGCAWSIGSKEGSTHENPTKGQELIDLKRAKDTGAINDAEYQAEKNRILSK